MAESQASNLANLHIEIMLQNNCYSESLKNYQTQVCCSAGQSSGFVQASSSIRQARQRDRHNFSQVTSSDRSIENSLTSVVQASNSNVSPRLNILHCRSREFETVDRLLRVHSQVTEGRGLLSPQASEVIGQFDVEDRLSISPQHCNYCIHVDCLSQIVLTHFERLQT